MTANTPPPPDPLQDTQQERVHWPAKSLRNTLVDSDGLEISASNPLDVTGVIGTGIPTDLDGAGDLTVGTSEVEITLTGTTSSIRIRADLTNTGIIYIGKTGVLSNGTNDFVRLGPGDEVEIDYDDVTNALIAISDTAAQKLNRGALL